MIFHREKILQDTCNDGLKVGTVDAGINVPERPADICGQQIENLLCGRGKASNGEVVAEHDHTEVDSREQVGEVVIDLSDFDVAIASSSLNGDDREVSIGSLDTRSPEIFFVLCFRGFCGLRFH